MFSQSLSLAQQQRQMMILAPQLRQSLEMLQLPIMELRAVIQQEMETNPLIEDVVSPHEVSLEGKQAEARQEERREAEGDSHEIDQEIAALTELDSEWRDYFLQDMQNNPYTAQDEERRQYMFDSLPQTVSLQAHLLEQVGLSDLDGEERLIAETIIGSIDDDGYLQGDIDELAQQTASEPARFARILQVVQEFHPTGIGARDLRECLLLQIKHLGESQPVQLAQRIIADYLNDLAAQRYQAIAAACQASEAQVEEAAALIKALNPYPGRLFAAGTPGYITPEITVRRNREGRWTVQLDDDQLPHIRISAHYRRLLEDPDTKPEVKSYIRERIRSGAFLIKSIQQRQRTIQRIAGEIVAAQAEFLDHGISHLQPMTMADVAERVGVHETTVSRTVANKYMRTPVGVFELKYFFTPGLKTTSGKAVSNKTVQDRIETMIKQESPAAPLSDQAIQEQLQAEGIEIARRTVAKYRESLNIPSSVQRRRMGRAG